MSGLFITFEGGDGSGKSTQTRLLSDWFEREGFSVVLAREPGGTDVGLAIREIVLHHRGDVSPRAEALLYAADRAQNIASVVRPALSRGEIVIQDRYIDSSVAYQGAGRVLDIDEILGLSNWAAESLKPSLTILLDIDPAAARQRLDAAEKRFDRLEAEAQSFHTEVRSAFLEIARNEPERFLVIDAELDAEVIAGRIRQRVSELLS